MVGVRSPRDEGQGDETEDELDGPRAGILAKGAEHETGFSCSRIRFERQDFYGNAVRRRNSTGFPAFRQGFET